MAQFNYNYIISNRGNSALEPLFSTWDQMPNVHTHALAFEGGKLQQFIFFLHWSNKINSIIRLPFKSIWYKRMCCQFPNDIPVCFVSFDGKYLTDDSGLQKYIKSLNPNNRTIVLCYDLISKKHWNIEEVKSRCDYIVTYDKGEAEKYGVHYLDMALYGPITDITEPTEFENDVYFLGYAKDRLAKIHDTYRFLTANGLKCKFIICGVDSKDQITGEGLCYRNPIFYRENIENVQKSKCVLEIIQGGSDAPTLRTEEAQVYKRKLLTNFVGIRDRAYYDPNNMRTFENEEDIDLNFLKAPIDYNSFNSGYDYSPKKLIDFLEDLITKEQEN